METTVLISLTLMNPITLLLQKIRRFTSFRPVKNRKKKCSKQASSELEPVLVIILSVDKMVHFLGLMVVARGRGACTGSMAAAAKACFCSVLSSNALCRGALRTRSPGCSGASSTASAFGMDEHPHRQLPLPPKLGFFRMDIICCAEATFLFELNVFNKLIGRVLEDCDVPSRMTDEQESVYPIEEAEGMDIDV